MVRVKNYKEISIMPEFSFLCVGFMKCGTTTFHEILKQHREIYLPIVKEPLYYSTH